jgi:hypothetical protein
MQAFFEKLILIEGYFYWHQLLIGEYYLFAFKFYSEVCLIYGIAIYLLH